jgi:hypothetical protein
MRTSATVFCTFLQACCVSACSSDDGAGASADAGCAVYDVSIHKCSCMCGAKQQDVSFPGNCSALETFTCTLTDSLRWSSCSDKSTQCVACTGTVHACSCSCGAYQDLRNNDGLCTELNSKLCFGSDTLMGSGCSSIGKDCPGR